MIQFLQEAAHVVPSKRQLDWYELESYAFIHFGVNTFTNREWGEGTEPESIFNPENLDCDQWVEAIKAAGMSHRAVRFRPGAGEPRRLPRVLQGLPHCADFRRTAGACLHGLLRPEGFLRRAKKWKL